jgi:O-antigen ligase
MRTRIAGQDNPAMPRLGGVAAFALVAALACDAGGFNALTWDRMLVLVSAAALVLCVVRDRVAVRRDGAVLVGLLALLTAWTALSWLWSESPPRALVEARLVALYCAVAALFAIARPPVRWVAGGVAAAAAFVAGWNLVTRIRGVGPETGADALPVGYANSLALLCVVGLLLLPLLPRLAALVLLPPLAVDLFLLKSTGALAALAAGALVYAAVRWPRVRVAAVVLAVIGVALSPVALRGHERSRYWHVALREYRSAPVLGTGAGTFSNWWLRYRPAPISTQQAHSLYLQTLAELGPIGLLLVAGALVAAAWRRDAAVSAVVAAYAVGAAADFHWQLAGVTVPVLVVAAADARGRPLVVSRRALVPAFAALTGAAVLAYGGSSRLDRARSQLRSGDTFGAEASARGALRLAPFSSDAWGVIGDATGDAGAYRRALDLDPNDWSLWYRLSSAETG